MEIGIVSNLYELVGDYKKRSDTTSIVRKELEPRPLSNFHQWADSRDFEGGFLIENQNGPRIWLLLIKWNDANGYYVVLFPEDKSGPIAEIHRYTDDKNGEHIRWTYSPKKRDNKNEERKEYFEKYYRSLNVVISLPTSIEDVDEFLLELLSLAENRQKADELDLSKPICRDGFPEGKIKEKLHRSRERNSRLVMQVKAEALEKYGRLECQCCSFDFEKQYGKLGSEFIEAHHLVPVSELHADGEETKKEDIALVCSNCHRMLHRKRPCLSMSDLKSLCNQIEEMGNSVDA